MKTLLCFFLVASFAFADEAAQKRLSSTVLKEIVSGGKTYKQVRITRCFSDGASIIHESGVATVDMSDLPIDVAADVVRVAAATNAPSARGAAEAGKQAARDSYSAERHRKALEETKKRVADMGRMMTFKVNNVVTSSTALCMWAPAVKNGETWTRLDSWDSSPAYVVGLQSPVSGASYSGTVYPRGRLSYSSFMRGRMIVAIYTFNLDEAAAWWQQHDGRPSGDITMDQVTGKQK